jgi:hypothetical protein
MRNLILLEISDIILNHNVDRIKKEFDLGCAPENDRTSITAVVDCSQINIAKATDYALDDKMLTYW